MAACCPSATSASTPLLSSSVNAITNGGRTAGSRVLFPILAETIRETPDRLYRRLRTARSLWILPTTSHSSSSRSGGTGSSVAYPTKYQEAGWMLRVLAAGSIPAVINQASGVLWPSLRRVPHHHGADDPPASAALRRHAARPSHVRGVGLVVGVASVELIFYPVQAFLIARRRLWQPELDMPVVLVSGVLIALGALLR